MKSIAVILLNIAFLNLISQISDTVYYSTTSSFKTVFFKCAGSGYNSSTYNNKYIKYETYIPNQNSNKKIIKLNYNVFLKSDGTGNFTPNDIPLLLQHFNWVRGFYLSNPPNSDPPIGITVNDLSNKYIDFELNAIYFYYDDYLYGLNWNILGDPSVSSFIQYIKNVDSNRLKELNIFFSEGTLTYFQSARGFAIFPSTTDIDLGCVILRSYTSNLDAILFTSAQTTAHEIGHTLELCHTYCGGGCCPSCDSSDIFYLYDVFGYPPNCPHKVSWSPPASDSPTDSITNNLMGGNLEMAYLSPKQIGQCHRSLYLLTTGKYTKCTYDSNNPWIINSNETWDFSFRSFEDIWVQAPAQLDIKCVLQLTDSAHFIVEPGAIVNVHPNAVIENRCGCNGNTFDIGGTFNVSGNFNIPPNSVINIYSNGVLSVDTLCINQNVTINIFNNGKIFIKGIDYTNQIIQYNSTYNALVTMPIVIGNVYAFNQIETQGNVHAFGNTTFKAGRKIKLKNGFKANNKFVATIDTLINNCEELQCGNSISGNKLIVNYDTTKKSIPIELLLKYKNFVSNNKLNLKINPTPTEHSVQITLSDKSSTIHHITIKDISGKIVLEQHPASTNITTLNVSELANGIYFVTVETTNSVFTEKLIIQK